MGSENTRLHAVAAGDSIGVIARMAERDVSRPTPIHMDRGCSADNFHRRSQMRPRVGWGGILASRHHGGGVMLKATRTNSECTAAFEL